MCIAYQNRVYQGSAAPSPLDTLCSGNPPAAGLDTNMDAPLKEALSAVEEGRGPQEMESVLKALSHHAIEEVVAPRDVVEHGRHRGGRVRLETLGG